MSMQFSSGDQTPRGPFLERRRPHSPPHRQFFSAICAKDLDRIIALYAPEVVVFDGKPPLQIWGVKAWREIWGACLQCLPEGFALEHRELVITVSGDMALAHWRGRFTGVDIPHGAAQAWLRSTAGYRKLGDT